VVDAGDGEHPPDGVGGIAQHDRFGCPPEVVEDADDGVDAGGVHERDVAQVQRYARAGGEGLCERAVEAGGGGEIDLPPRHHDGLPLLDEDVGIERVGRGPGFLVREHDGLLVRLHSGRRPVDSRAALQQYRATSRVGRGSCGTVRRG
jgi:hypothetical protein